MRPKPLQLEPLPGHANFYRDQRGGLVWHRCAKRVLYAETDCSGVVYHSNFLVYFEEGRASLMRELGHPYAQVEKGGFVYPIVSTALNYYQSLQYDDLAHVYTRLADLEPVRVRFEYLITKEDAPVIVCDGFTLHCALNQRRMPTSVDELTRAAFAAFPR